MRLRSLLFVPGDRPDRMEKALSTGTDALILDLEDSVTLANKEKARQATATFVSRYSGNTPLFVRINPLENPQSRIDIAIIGQLSVAGVMLPKSENAASIMELASLLQEQGKGDLPILPIATETPSAIFGLGSYREAGHHLCGLTWGAEDLPAAIGATASREEDGSYTSPYVLVRALTLFAAHAASVPAIETVYPAFRDLDGLKAYTARGRRDGFTGMLAIHPDQVAPINQAFTPDRREIDWAQKVVDTFAANPGAGAVQLDGRMLDLPHLKQAHRILAASNDAGHE